MEKESTKNNQGNSTEKTQSGSASIVESDRNKEVRSPDSSKTDKENQKENIDAKPKHTLWVIIKIFMKREDAAEWTMSVLTLVMVVLTVMTTIINNKLIDIAIESNTLTRKSLETQNRAWLAIDVISVEADIPDRPVFPYDCKIMYQIKNTGNTPAVEVSQTCSWSENPIPDSWFDSTYSSFNGFGIPLTPNYSIDIDSIFSNRIRKDTPYYIAIVVGYRDIFDSLRRSEIYRHYTSDNMFTTMPKHNTIK